MFSAFGLTWLGLKFRAHIFPHASTGMEVVSTFFRLLGHAGCAEAMTKKRKGMKKVFKNVNGWIFKLL
jgi:hypothetical protein